MRVLVLARLKGDYDFARLGRLVKGVHTWTENHSSEIEAFHFFAGGWGGLAILNALDEQSLNTLVMDCEFLMSSDLEFQPLVDTATLLGRWAQGGIMPIG